MAQEGKNYTRGKLERCRRELPCHAMQGDLRGRKKARNPHSTNNLIKNGKSFYLKKGI